MFIECTSLAKSMATSQLGCFKVQGKYGNLGLAITSGCTSLVSTIHTLKIFENKTASVMDTYILFSPFDYFLNKGSKYGKYL